MPSPSAPASVVLKQRGRCRRGFGALVQVDRLGLCSSSEGGRRGGREAGGGRGREVVVTVRGGVHLVDVFQALVQKVLEQKQK